MNRAADQRYHIMLMLDRCQTVKEVIAQLGYDAGMIVGDYISAAQFFARDTKYKICTRCFDRHTRRKNMFCHTCKFTCVDCGKIRMMHEDDLICMGCKPKYPNGWAWMHGQLNECWGKSNLWYRWHMVEWVRDFAKKYGVDMRGPYLFQRRNTLTVCSWHQRDFYHPLINDLGFDHLLIPGH